MAMWQTSEETIEKTRIEEPPMYRVILNNDDYTPQDFVVMILINIFRKDEQTAFNIMMDVHRRGKGVCGIYTREVAETKVKQVEELAEKNRFPLLCTMEEE